VGLLFGTTDGSLYTVCDNTDVIIEGEGSSFVISNVDIERRRRLWTTVYQTFQLIGWYSFGNSVAPAHSGFHSSIQAYATDPIFLLFDSSPDKHDFEKIPIQAFKSAGGSFSAIPFKIDSPDVEKIAIDEIIQSVPHGFGSSMESFNSNVSISLTALERKLAKIIDHLNKMQNREIEWDANFARNAASVVQALERMNSGDIQSSINSEVTDSLMGLYLGSATKSLAATQELQSLYSTLHSFDKDIYRK
jgi:hypothetical protein